MDWEFDAFISYNHADEAFAKYVQQSLEASSLKVFRDATGLQLFDKLDASLKNAISRSNRLISLVSPSYLNSYWCLFEALEAIQGEDLEKRFLPAVIRYSAGDTQLNEDFVFSILEDVGKRVTDIQSKIIATNAFALHSQLDKLTFIQANLPRIFTHINQRLYPEFHLWEPETVPAMMAQTIRSAWPGTEPVVAAYTGPTGSASAAATAGAAPGAFPEILWQRRIGCFSWRNQIVPCGRDLLISSSGDRWNWPDGADGLYCLNAETGNPKWFAHTPSDANGVLVCKGLAIAGCDDGTLLAVSVTTGREAWSVRLDSAIIGGPIKLDSQIGQGLAANNGTVPADPILVVTYWGRFYVLDVATGKEIGSCATDARIIAQPTLVRRERGSDIIAAPAYDGDMIFLEYDDLRSTLTEFERVPLVYPSEYADGGVARAQLAATPFQDGTDVYQGLVRNTTYPEIPLARLRLSDDPFDWSATVVWSVGGEPPGGRTGNLRHRPVKWGEALLIAPAYSNAVFAVDRNDGSVLWSIEVGQSMFEQWSSPVLAGSSLYLARHDGYLHKLDVERQSREWSLYLGDPARAGAVVAGGDLPPDFFDRPVWRSGSSSPIVATPTLRGHRAYVGAHDGTLYCITNI